jgi:hypothetical protein
MGLAKENLIPPNKGCQFAIGEPTAQLSITGYHHRLKAMKLLWISKQCF